MHLRIIGTTLILGIFSSLIVNGISQIDSRNRLLQVLAWISLITSLIASILLILAVWGAFDVHCPGGYVNYRSSACYASWQLMMEFISKALWVCIFVAFTTAIDGRFLQYDNNNWLITVFRGVTITCTTFLGLLFVISTLVEEFPDFLFKPTIIMVILVVLGLIGTPILCAIDRHRSRQIIDSQIQVNEQNLRAKIEQEVRAQIAAEQAAQTKTPSSTASTGKSSAS